MKVKRLERSFIIERNGKDIPLDDPNPNWSIEEIRKFLGTTQPDILNADVSGPEIKDDKQVYTFSAGSAVKTKG
jgi:PRTRC genetic system protein C